MAIAVFLGASLLVGKELDTLTRLWIPATITSGWFIFFDGPDTVPYAITWSISVEEFAYVLFGMAAFLLGRRKMPLVLVLAIILPILLRYHLFDTGWPKHHVYYFPPARIDSVALGGLLAYAMAREVPRVLPILILAEVIFIALAQVNPVLGLTHTYTAISILALIAIYLAETSLKGRSHWIARRMAKIGFYSYFIYLFHYFNIDISLRLIRPLLDPVIAIWLAALAATIATYAQAWLSFRYFEGPLMRWARRFETRADVAPMADVRRS